MEAPENTSPRDLRPNVDYAATLWGPAHRPLATGVVTLSSEEQLNYDGTFEILGEECPVSPETPGIAISTGNYQIAAIRPVDGVARDSYRRIRFLWAET